jgi:hypothetical protein
MQPPFTGKNREPAVFLRAVGLSAVDESTAVATSTILMFLVLGFSLVPCLRILYCKPLERVLNFRLVGVGFEESPARVNLLGCL